ncbi:Zn(2)-C6 fungal-specific transcription factor [Phycomyces blakesleeanus]
MTSPTTQYNPYTPDQSDNNKRKKASRACFHCQKAHLTCDDSRPCQRCIKRDLAATCTDAARKKAKYLQDLTPQDSKCFYMNSTHHQNQNQNQNQNLNQNHSQQQQHQNFTAFNSTSIPTATNSPMTNNFPLRTSFGQPVQSPTPPPVSLPVTTKKPSLIEYNSPSTSTPISSSTSVSAPVSASASALALSLAPAPGPGPGPGPGNRRRNITAEEAYQSVQRPFNYAKGFHYLIQYVRDRMGQDDLMRISRALALFRPSFLALIMNLTEEDLIFMEKCLQRTLLEYEKLISFSGTPTVVWRRTGEVCLVGKEFSLLTQWSKDMLMHRKTYIYELMDNQSAVEYWEKFATHAFDNTDKSCIYSCILRTPHQKAVPCTFCFTIKRDIFDLPSVIVGNVSFFFFFGCWSTEYMFQNNDYNDNK